MGIILPEAYIRKVEDKGLKTAIASTSISVDVNCPYCDHYQDRLDELAPCFDYMELRTNECEAEIKCESCCKNFIVTKIEY